MLESNSFQEVTKQCSTQNRNSTISINPDIETSNLGLNERDDSSSSQGVPIITFIKDEPYPSQKINLPWSLEAVSKHLAFWLFVAPAMLEMLFLSGLCAK